MFFNKKKRGVSNEEDVFSTKKRTLQKGAW